jgi:hypothetical protein
MWQVIFVLDSCPLFSSWMVLVLSCWIMVSHPIFFKTESSLIDLICCSTNSCIYSTKFIASSTPTNSASVELFVLIFCYMDNDIRAPCPNDSTAPVWLHMSLCIANDASTDHKSWPVPSHPNTSGINNIVDRILVMAPILAPILGVHFFGGIFPSKMGRFAPFLATIQALSKICAFLFNKRSEGCFVSDAPQLVLAPTIFIIALFSWVSVGNRLRLVLKLAKEVQSLTCAENIFSLNT